MAIVVYGLINFKAFFEARQAAEKLRAQHPSLYPYLEADYTHYPSLRPEYRGHMVQLALMMNDELKDMVVGWIAA